MTPVPQVVRGVLRSALMPAFMAWERVESGVSYNPISAKTIAYPFDKYEELRQKDPVHRLRTINAWVLTEYEHANAVLRDHARFSRDYGGKSAYRSMLDTDPPDHTRLRTLVSKAFTPRSVADLEPRIHQLVDSLFDEIEGQDSFDLIDAFAYPLPVIVIAEMLGVPSEDIEVFKEWSNDIALSIEPTVSDEQQRRIDEAGANLYDYFEGIIEQRRRVPQDDMITALIAAEDEGDRLSHEELLATLLLLLVAGNETTRNLIGNGTLALLRNPDQMDRLRNEPELIDSAINEMLRYDSPVQLDGRMATEEVEIGGKLIKPGQRAICILGAANRDPSVFTNPEVFDIGRQEGSHIAFGRGIHYCLGAPLAMLEGRIAFTSLLDRFSSIRLLSEPEYREQVVLRGVKDLWIEVERSPRSESERTEQAAASVSS